MVIRLLVIFLLFCQPAWAAWPDARVVRMLDGGSASFVDVGGKVVLISCAHRTIDTAINVGDSVPFECNDGSRGTATVAAVAKFDLAGEPLSDCAIYSFPGSVGPNVKPLKISQRPLQPGDKVWVCGFPYPQFQFLSRSTKVISDGSTLWLAGESTPGESGGPVINAYGELVGTLSISTNQHTTGCCGRAVESQFCNSFTANWCGGGGCSNGSCGYIYQQQGYSAPQQPRTYSPIPAPPAVKTPAPQPTLDWTEWRKQQSDMIDAQNKRMDEGFKSVVVAINGQPKCNCQPTDLTEINAKLDSLSLAFGELQKKSAEQPKPFYLRVNPSAPYQPVSPGQYVTLPLDKAK